MAGQSFIQLRPYRTKSYRKVSDKFSVVIPNIKDLGVVVQQVAAAQIQEQIALKNPPVNFVVDNSGVKPFNQADFRVTAYFSNSELVAKAVNEIYKQLKSVTKSGKTGMAKSSFEIWISRGPNDRGKKIGKAPMAESRLQKLADKLGPNGLIVVAGPMVDYGRHLYWRPKFGARNIKTTVRSYKGAYDMDTGKALAVGGTRSKNMRDIVLRRVRHRYKGLPISGRWVVGRTVGSNKGANRWPGIGVGVKQTGKLR